MDHEPTLSGYRAGHHNKPIEYVHGGCDGGCRRTGQADAHLLAANNNSGNLHDRQKRRDARCCFVDGRRDETGAAKATSVFALAHSRLCFTLGDQEGRCAGCAAGPIIRTADCERKRAVRGMRSQWRQKAGSACLGSARLSISFLLRDSLQSVAKACSLHECLHIQSRH